MTLEKRRFNLFLALGLAGATIALALAALSPPKAPAFGSFSNGVLTISGGEGKIVPRCASDGHITVSGAPTDEPAYCRDLRKIVAIGFGIPHTFDFSQLPDDLGGGQGPIEIEATGGKDNDKFIGAAKHKNTFNGGKGSDSATGGDLNDKLGGGESGDKLDGGGGKDTLTGGPGGDKLTGGPGADSLFGGKSADKLLGGPGRDLLRGGGSQDSLVGGPGKDKELQ